MRCPANLHLVGYARVSTQTQALHGTSVLEQQRAIQEWCTANGHVLMHLHVDNGVTGRTPAEERPGLAGALLDIQDGRAGGLVVRELDRLARELHTQEAALARVWDLGARAFEVTHGEVLRDDPSDPYRTFVRQVMGAAAQLESSMVRVRLQRGRSAKHRRGGYAGGLTVPFGEMVEGSGRDAERRPDPRSVEAIARMRHLRAEGLTFAQIAERLNASGIATARGGRWHGMTIKRVCDRLPA